MTTTVSYPNCGCCGSSSSSSTGCGPDPRCSKTSYFLKFNYSGSTSGCVAFDTYLLNYTADSNGCISPSRCFFVTDPVDLCPSGTGKLRFGLIITLTLGIPTFTVVWAYCVPGSPGFFSALTSFAGADCSGGTSSSIASFSTGQCTTCVPFTVTLS